jgi:heme-degrading monooxygenase HmoA
MTSTPAPPYFAVIFTSARTDQDQTGYELMAQRMEELAERQPGFLGIESVRGADGQGITVSYWQTEEAIRHWRDDAEHRLAQQQGREKWYSRFTLRVCRVERAWDFAAGQ